MYAAKKSAKEEGKEARKKRRKNTRILRTSRNKKRVPQVVIIPRPQRGKERETIRSNSMDIRKSCFVKLFTSF